MTGFFEEQIGVKSMMRLMSFIILIFFIVVNLGFAALYMHSFYISTIDKLVIPSIDPNVIWFNCVILSFAFFPKLGQKLLEMKFGIKSEPDNPKTETTLKTEITQKTE